MIFFYFYREHSKEIYFFSCHNLEIVLLFLSIQMDP